MLTGMPDPVRTIRLKLRLDGDSPAGSANVSGEQPREFAGWLGLVAAIEALLTSTKETGDGREQSRPSPRPDAGEPDDLRPRGPRTRS